MTAHTQLLVYNSENRFVGFFYQFTCRVERTKGLKDKTEFWDRLIWMQAQFRARVEKSWRPSPKALRGPQKVQQSFWRGRLCKIS